MLLYIISQEIEPPIDLIGEHHECGVTLTGKCVLVCDVSSFGCRGNGTETYLT